MTTKLDTRVKHREAIKLVRAGASYTSAAKKLGMSPETVRKAWAYHNGGPRTVPAYTCEGCLLRVTLKPCVKCAADAAERARIEALRPDREKMLAFAAAIQAVEQPQVSPAARKSMALANESLAMTLAAIRELANSLTGGES